MALEDWDWPSEPIIARATPPKCDELELSLSIDLHRAFSHVSCRQTVNRSLSIMPVNGNSSFWNWIPEWLDDFCRVISIVKPQTWSITTHTSAEWLHKSATQAPSNTENEMKKKKFFRFISTTTRCGICSHDRVFLFNNKKKTWNNKFYTPTHRRSRGWERKTWKRNTTVGNRWSLKKAKRMWMDPLTSQRSRRSLLDAP